MTSQLLRDSPIGRLVEVRGRDPRTGNPINGLGYVPDPLPHDVAATLDVGVATVRQAMNAFVDAGILSTRAPARRGKTQVYFADAIIAALSGGVDED